MPAASIMRFCGSLAFVRQASVYRYLYLDGFVVTFPSTRPCRLANSFFPSQPVCAKSASWRVLPTGHLSTNMLDLEH